MTACRRHFAVAATFSALVNILYLAPTIYMMQVYDRVVPTQGVLTLVWLTVVVACGIATLAALDALRSRIMVAASQRLNHILSGEILHRLMARRKVSEGEPSTAQAMRDFDTLRQALGGQATITLFDVPWTPLYLIVAFMIHPILALLIVAGGSILVALALVNERDTKQQSLKALKTSASAYAAQDLALNKAEVVRALGMRRAMVKRQLDAREEGVTAGANAQVGATRYNALVKFFRMFLQSLALGLAAWLAVKGQISVGAIIAGSVLLSRALQPIEQLVNVWPTIVQARQAAGSLRALFEATDALFEKPMTLPRPLGHLVLSNISVRNAEGSALILRGANINLVPGEVMGLVGPSGAGKTTLARVAAGALMPDGGDVRIDEASFADWDPEQLARHIGYLPQDCALLPGTIGENISRFAGELETDAEQIDRDVVAAAVVAGIHDVVLHLPGGYNCRVGDAKNGLSGGETQRIALARALFRDPQILILDEPSSALDSEGEEALLAAMESAKARGAAILIVAHRASILRNVDRLAVLNQGVIDHQGSRQEVMSALQAARASENVVNMRGR